MSLRSTTLLICGTALLVGTTQSFAAEGNLYRYRDNQGTVVMTRNIPPEAIKNGYQVLSPTGRVIEVVPPAPTAAELAAREAAAPEAKRQKEAAQKQAEYDDMLLRLYSQPQEAADARDRRLQEIDSVMSLKRGNIQVLTGQIKDIETKAADIERSGRTVPEEMYSNIKRLQANIAELNAAIDKIEQERKATEKDFAEKIDRLKYLQSLRQKQEEKKAASQKTSD